MNGNLGMIIGAVFVTIVILSCLANSRGEWLVNIIMRSVLGTIAMYFINGWLAAAGISLGIGLNIVTVLTIGILGFPGLLALYGLGIYQLL